MNLVRLLPIPVVALALTAAGASAHENGKAFEVTGKVIAPPAAIDLGAPGPSAGDEQIISMDVFKGAKKIGESHVVCVTVRAGVVQCDNVTHLPAGDIVATGLVTAAQEETSPFTQAITGGTGAYRNAHGELTVSEAGPQPATLRFEIS
jgi:hypothetical protein